MTEEVQTTEAAAPAESLDLLGAAALFAEREQQQEAQAQPAQEAPAETTQPEQAAAEEAPPESETTQGEQPEEPAAAEPEDASYDLDKIHGNTKIRLRDGSEWSAGELKRRIADLQEVDNHRASFAQEIQKFQAERSQTQQQAQLFAQIAPQAIAAIQASLPQVPPLPEPSLAQTDPFAYSERLAAHMTAKDARDQKIAQMQQIQRVAYEQNVRAQQENAQRLADTVQNERQKLLEKFPEFADSGKAKEFQSEFTRFGKLYGFNDQELSQVYDHRLVGVMRDAIAYRKLQNAPKPKPTTQTTGRPMTQSAPVQQPGRRVLGNEAKTVQRQELFQKMQANRGDLRMVAELAAKAGIA